MNFPYIFLFVALVFLAPFGLIVPSAESRELDRDTAIQLAFSNQPELKLAMISIDRAASRLRSSGRLENPELELSLSDDGIGRNEGEANYEVAFVQRFPLTARLKHEKGLRRHQVILAEAEIAEKRRELAGEVDRALIELLALREKQRLTADGLKLNRDILKFLEEKVAVGEASKLDAMQAKLAVRTLDQERDRLEAQEKQARLLFARRLGLKDLGEWRLGEGLDLPPRAPQGQADYELVLKRRPDYILGLAKIDEARASLVLEEAKRWEDVSFKVFVEGEKVNDVPVGLERNTFAGIGISIPLPLRHRNQDGIEQARLDGESASRQVEAIRFAIESECEEAYRSRLDAWRLAQEAAGELPSLAKEQLAEVRAAHEKGEASFLQVRQAQDQLLEVRATALAFLSDYHLAEARVRFVTGAYRGVSGSPQSSK